MHAISIKLSPTDFANKSIVLHSKIDTMLDASHLKKFY